ncbi:MAG: glycine--tRNA ligase subunit beta [Thermochromatium sp.]
MATTDLLIEIGTEELPPLALPILSRAFLEGFRDQLKTNGIGFEAIEPFATPRRLALLVKGIRTRQPDQVQVRRGPAVQAAFDAEGRPTQALLGFARSCGVEVEGLEREESDKGVWLVHRRVIPGRETAELVPEMTESALAGLPIPKRMRWGDRSEEFVRPVHWICLMLGTEPVAGTVMGLPAGPYTWGHRFHHPGPIAIGQASDYAETLRQQGRVEPSFERRRERIREQVMTLAASHGLRARLDPDLLDEVTALVEWPQALLCTFDERFLEIPPEVLIETMQSNQKYFPVEDEHGALQARFIVVANLESRDPDQVRAGNERVIRPRFADAAFFWSQDLKQPLEAFAPRLKTVIFQDQLGTQAAKCARVAQLGRVLAPTIGVDPGLVERAAALSKCDLMTAMVFEFPRLQGIMGRYYAERSGENPCVSAAMEDQYRPRCAGDTLPVSLCGRALALADRLDTLVGIFGIGLRPSGTKDPYALRRSSIAVLRILIETPLDLDLRDLLERAAAGFPAGLLAEDTVETVLGYMLERLRGYYADQAVALDTVESVIHTGVTNPWDLDRRIAAVTQFRRLPAAEALAAAHKRIRNILLKAEPSDLTEEGGPDPALLVEIPEQRLAERIAELKARVEPLSRARDYVAILTTLAELREDVDAFFDEVMVMVEDPARRRNRLRLLRSLAALFLRVADISRLK